MVSTLPSTFLLGLNLDRSADEPLYNQLYHAFRTAILDHQFESGLRLPSSRDLAEMLDVSRHTILNALDQLIAEGYLMTRPGAGTYVTEALPNQYWRSRQPTPSKSELNQSAPDHQRPLAPLGETFRRLAPRLLAKDPPQEFQYDFTTGKPDLTIFPFDVWARLSAKNYRYMPPTDFGFTAPQGYLPLRTAIAEHLRVIRSLRCKPEQILITQGTQQAMYLIQRMVLHPTDQFWMENPGYGGAYGALATGGAQYIPVPVDNEGLIVEKGIELAPHAKLAYVTPTHQYPLGHMLSLTRRMELLEWANQAGAWIIEDDYDSEFQYEGLPLASLQGLDRDQRVIYTGTFSKVLFPTLRMGYLVLPPDLVDPFVSFRSVIDNSPPLISQMVLADFMFEGHFTRHLRRMRKVYAEKRTTFLAACEEFLADKIEYLATNTGMHISLRLPAHLNDRAIAEQAMHYDVQITALSAFDFGNAPQPYNGLVLGYTCLTCEEITEGIQRLALAIADVAPVHIPNMGVTTT